MIRYRHLAILFFWLFVPLSGAQAASSFSVPFLPLFQPFTTLLAPLFTHDTPRDFAQIRRALLQKAAHSPQEAWEYLKRAAQEDKKIDMASHELSHLVGAEAYRVLGSSGIGICDSTFLYGCYHGFMEGFLADGKSVSDAYDACAEVIEERLAGSGLNIPYVILASCVHGIGHGVMEARIDDLFGALADCEILPEDRQVFFDEAGDILVNPVVACKEGVFMEQLFRQQTVIPQDDPWSACPESLGEENRMVCARYIHILEYPWNLPLSQTIEICLGAPNASLRDNCFYEVGFFEKGFLDAPTVSPAQIIKDACGTIADERARYRCLRAGAITMTALKRPPNAFEAARSICEAAGARYANSCTASAFMLGGGTDADTPSAEAFSRLSHVGRFQLIDEFSRRNPKEAWEYLRGMGFSVAGFSHNLGHIIGDNLYRKYGLSALDICTPEFGYSCYHAVIAMILIHDDEYGVANIESLCRVHAGGSTDEERTSLFRACVHGAGHGFLSYYIYDAKQAVNACAEAFSPGMRRFCYDGIFMELPDTTLARETVRLNPWKMCEGFPEEAGLSCARMLSAAPPRNVSGTSAFTPDIAAEYFALCGEAPTEGMRAACAGIVENYLVALAPASEIPRLCAEIGDEGGRQCIFHTAAEYSFQQRLDAASVSATFCASLEDPEEHLSCVARAARAGVLGKSMKHLKNVSIFDPRPYE